jgi:hypothetical protein
LYFNLVTTPPPFVGPANKGDVKYETSTSTKTISTSTLITTSTLIETLGPSETVTSQSSDTNSNGWLYLLALLPLFILVIAGYIFILWRKRKLNGFGPIFRHPDAQNRLKNIQSFEFENEDRIVNHPGNSLNSIKNFTKAVRVSPLPLNNLDNYVDMQSLRNGLDQALVETTICPKLSQNASRLSDFRQVTFSEKSSISNEQPDSKEKLSPEFNIDMKKKNFSIERETINHDIQLQSSELSGGISASLRANDDAINVCPLDIEKCDFDFSKRLYLNNPVLDPKIKKITSSTLVKKITLDPKVMRSNDYMPRASTHLPLLVDDCTEGHGIEFDEIESVETVRNTHIYANEPKLHSRTQCNTSDCLHGGAQSHVEISFESDYNAGSSTLMDGLDIKKVDNNMIDNRNDSFGNKCGLKAQELTYCHYDSNDELIEIDFRPTTLTNSLKITPEVPDSIRKRILMQTTSNVQELSDAVDSKSFSFDDSICLSERYLQAALIEDATISSIDQLIVHDNHFKEKDCVKNNSENQNGNNLFTNISPVLPPNVPSGSVTVMSEDRNEKKCTYNDWNPNPQLGQTINVNSTVQNISIEECKSDIISARQSSSCVSLVLSSEGDSLESNFTSIYHDVSDLSSFQTKRSDSSFSFVEYIGNVSVKNPVVARTHHSSESDTSGGVEIYEHEFHVPPNYITLLSTTTDGQMCNPEAYPTYKKKSFKISNVSTDIDNQVRNFYSQQSRLAEADYNSLSKLHIDKVQKTQNIKGKILPEFNNIRKLISVDLEEENKSRSIKAEVEDFSIEFSAQFSLETDTTNNHTFYTANDCQFSDSSFYTAQESLWIQSEILRSYSEMTDDYSKSSRSRRWTLSRKSSSDSYRSCLGRPLSFNFAQIYRKNSFNYVLNNQASIRRTKSSGSLHFSNIEEDH